MRRVWDIRDVDDLEVESLAATLRISKLLARLLLGRKVTDEQAGRKFLSPSLHDLHDPFLMRDMDRVVARLVEAMKASEKVCVWGDYDVDGITATTLLLLFLRRVGLDVTYHIPSRIADGYGLNAGAIDRIAGTGARLLITVDCGISDREPIRHARTHGLEVIVLDHHQVPDELPQAAGILNPHRPDCDFPTQDLAAVGVAFNLVMALRANLRERGAFQTGGEPNLREMLDLVALGTVADIVPLLNENRIVTYFGLQELSAGRRPGVAALKEVAGLFGERISTGQVAFRLAPRINAAGRLGMAQKGVELLATRSYSRALALARELDEANSRRQAIEQVIYNQAVDQAEKQFRHAQSHSLVMASDEWHVGVVGVVASRLVDRYACPVVLIALEGDRGRGSARGVEGVHLYEAMVSCADHLTAFGGHRLAAGLTVEREALDSFRQAFSAAVAQQQANTDARQRSIRIDAQVPPARWDQQSVASLERLAPHGLGNPEPVFLARDVEVKAVRTVGREPPYHVKAFVVDDGQKLDAIGFRLGDRLADFADRMDLLYTPEFNTWEGQTTIQLRLLDLRPIV